MKKRLFILLALLGGCSPKPVETLTKQPNRVFYASTDLNQDSTADSIARIKPGLFILGNKMKITLRNGDRRDILKKDIWGYSDEEGKVWRQFKKSFYQVVRIEDVVEYRIIEGRTYAANTSNYTANEPVTMYSKTLDSKIVNSRKRAIKTSDEPTE